MQIMGHVINTTCAIQTGFDIHLKKKIVAPLLCEYLLVVNAYTTRCTTTPSANCLNAILMTTYLLL